jgi:phosphoribosylglycinamide formyltransferase-1
MRNIVLLISGGGSNMAAIVAAAQRDDWPARLDARIAGVISNRADAGGLNLARQAGLATATIDHRAYSKREDFDDALAQQIAQWDVGGNVPALVLLAGFMRIVSPAFVARHQGRLLNIHPSLLPAFPGLHTHQRAIDAGCRFAGASVHEVTAELDHGPILGQAVVPVLPGDSAERLAARVLTQEHLLYPRVVKAFLRRPID